MASARKTAANRRNAQRSTGPRTPEGKRVSRYNALRHGLLAKEVVVTSGEHQESQAEFDSLLAALAEDLQPVGISENLIVERIAVCQWRLRRAARYEAAEIRRSQGVPGSGEEDGDEGDAPLTRVNLLLGSLASLAPVAGGLPTALAKTTVGIAQCLELVTDARIEVFAQGHLSKLTMKRLLATFGPGRDSVAITCLMYNYPLIDHDEDDEDEPQFPQLLEDPPSPEEAKQYLLRALSDEYDALKHRQEAAAEREARQRERRAAQEKLDRPCLALPPEGATNRLLRYETTIERQLYRAYAELERLQRRRGGTAVTGGRLPVTGTRQDTHAEVPPLSGPSPN